VRRAGGVGLAAAMPYPTPGSGAGGVGGGGRRGSAAGAPGVAPGSSAGGSTDMAGSTERPPAAGSAAPAPGTAQGCEACRARWAGGGPALSPGESRSGRYTPCDVALHASEGDLWLSAHGVVYDVTPFLRDHPGGMGSILRHGGRDSGVDFDFHSRQAQRLWGEFAIGRLVPCDGSASGGGWCAVS
jgi:hypothetical protein